MLLAVITYLVDLRVHGHDHPSAHADERTLPYETPRVLLGPKQALPALRGDAGGKSCVARDRGRVRRPYPSRCPVRLAALG